MNLQVFGLGAAGNKAALTLVEKGVLDQSKVKLLNTTTKDIPDKYKSTDMVVQFASDLGGCGKEPKKGNDAMLKAIKNKSVDFGQLILEDTQEVVLVTSTEGGTGCGATPLVVKYFVAMNIPVHVFALVGFQEDERAIKNTLQFFKNMDDSVILHTIKNKDFLDYTNNYAAAEKAANDDFAIQVQIMTGSKMIPSEQNIDDADMYKISITTGLMDVKHIPLTGVKNEDTFNEAIINAYENSKAFEFEPSAKRLAVFINADDKVLTSIDDSFEVLKRYVGQPKELFKHVQYDNSDEYIDVIACGLAFPEKEIQNIYKEYQRVKSEEQVKHNSFKDIFSGIDFDDDDDDLDVSVKKMNNPDDINAFFASEIKPNTKVQNIIAKDDDPAKEY